MFSATVPSNSHFCSTIPNERRRLSRVSVVMSPAVDLDHAAVQLVKAHQQIDERRLARAGRADDGDGRTRRGGKAEMADKRLLFCCTKS